MKVDRTMSSNEVRTHFYVENEMIQDVDIDTQLSSTDHNNFSHSISLPRFVMS